MGYPDRPAELAGEKYQPSNGTEGAIFIDSWCVDCARDKAMREGADFDDCDDNELCEILAASFLYKVDDPRYPSEWQYDKQGQPCCTAFVRAESEIPVPRCPLTIDMFEGGCRK
jgi:hypothetical protein